MYERFTDRARKVMQLANQEAQRLNHEFIGTEHVLLGLVKEGSGIAGNVLLRLKVDVRAVRAETEKYVKPGPDMITMGKLPFTPRVKRFVENAIAEARSLGHNYVGTEHLLLGLLVEQEGVAFDVLSGLGVAADAVRAEVFALIGRQDSPSAVADEPVAVNVIRLLTLLGEVRSLASKAHDGMTSADRLAKIAGLTDEIYKAVGLPGGGACASG